MKEIEVKVIGIDQSKVVEKLNSIGAKKTFDGIVHTVFFDFPDHRIKNAKDLFRLRKVGNSSFITFKKFVPNKSVKIRNEYEIEVSDFSTAEIILKGIGCVPELSVKKRRVSYKLDDVHFELDKHLDDYDYIPWFLEIETKDEKTLSEYIHKFGFSKDQCKSWSFFEVAEFYKK